MPEKMSWIDFAKYAFDKLLQVAILVLVTLGYIRMGSTATQIETARAVQDQTVERQEAADRGRAKIETTLIDNTRRLYFATWKQAESKYESSGEKADQDAAAAAKAAFEDYAKKHPNGGK